MHGLKKLALFVGTLLPFASAAPIESSTSAFIPNKYIVTLKEDVVASKRDAHLSWVNDVHSRSLGRRQLPGVKKTYSINTFQGYAGSFDEATIEEIKASPEVQSRFSFVTVRRFNHG